MIAFSYVGLHSLLWVWLFHADFLSHLPPSCFLEGLSSEQFAELESVHLLARVCSLAFLSLRVSFLAISRAVLIYLVLFSGLFWGLSIFSDSVDFSFSKGSVFLIFLVAFPWVFFYSAFLLSGSVLSSTLYIGLLCLLRMHTINSCVGDAWQRHWWDDFTHNGKQAVNRLKIPQGLSTLMFRRWSEVPSRGGVRGDSP